MPCGWAKAAYPHRCICRRLLSIPRISAAPKEDYQTADIIFAEINKYVYPANIQILVDEIAPDVMNLESEKAITKIDKLKENLEA